MIDAILQQFEEYNPDKWTRAEALLHEVYLSILIHGGSDQYKVPHSNIPVRQNCGERPVDAFITWEVCLAGDIARDALENGAPVEYPEDPPEDENDDPDDDEDH
jgi:hypothetical protein